METHRTGEGGGEIVTSDVLRSALHKLQWGSRQDQTSSDLSPAECRAVSDELERLEAQVTELQDLATKRVEEWREERSRLMFEIDQLRQGKCCPDVDGVHSALCKTEYPLQFYACARCGAAVLGSEMQFMKCQTCNQIVPVQG